MTGRGIAWRLALIVVAVALLGGSSVSAEKSKGTYPTPGAPRWVDSAASHFCTDTGIFRGVDRGLLCQF